MNKLWILWGLGILGLFSSCKSDDVMSKDEYELRTLLNHEWEAIEALDGIFDLEKLEYPVTAEKIDSLFDLKTRSLEYVSDKISLGMNKKGGFYAFSGKHFPPFYGSQHGSIIYFCSTQEKNRFSGKFYEVSAYGEPEAYDGEIYIRKIDENTIKVLILKHGEDDNRRFMDYGVYVLNKKGAWNESTSIKGILESYNAEAQFIEFIGGEHFERDVAQGRCK